MSFLHESVWICMEETMNRSGMRPSSCICDGRKLGFHCWRTMRVFSKPASTIAAPTARTPAGGSFILAKIDRRPAARSALRGRDRRADPQRPADAMLSATRAEMREQCSQIGEIDIAVAVDVAVGEGRAACNAEMRELRRQIGEIDLMIAVQIARKV